ncbi:hypothetical protein EPUS_04601 [Endocarpon pusillum Z07020]|uniref:Uncharacterized protein n=1 Tax=Endocarpon pusillum (strain Z07020 / HMAS-L-300199) TaxID=1263415 RepID=U1GUC7_ENDPU|nr:uncharacterized protein EPUS_04601 [Endocarpon pusillum Z07020]ERF75621.1 hypothetical protein EPUS_04601 [Endocarpon pusillum Z07020]
MNSKIYRIENSENPTGRWLQDNPQRWRPSIVKAQDRLVLLRSQLVELNNKRSSVRRSSLDPSPRNDSKTNTGHLATFSHPEPIRIDQSAKNQVTANVNASKNNNLGFTSTFLKACQHLLAEIWKCCSRDQERAVIRQNRVHYDLSRLILWGDLFDSGQLDVCTEKSAEIRDCVLKIFYKIGTTLIKGVLEIEAVASTSPNENIISHVDAVTDHLETTRSMLNLPDDYDETADTDSESSEGADSPKPMETKFHRDLENYILCLTDLSPTLEEILQDVDMSRKDQGNQAQGISPQSIESAKQSVINL